MAAFDQALARVRQDLGDLLRPDRVNDLARASDHTFRDTVLTPGNTLCWFVQQVAQGNVACAAVRHLAGEEFSDSAWCQARSRLPLELIRQVHQELIEQTRHPLDESDDACRWHGHCVYVMDGTGDSMPDTPALRSHYGVSGNCRPGLGFPTSHLLLLMERHSGLLVDCHDASLRSSDATMAPAMHPHLSAGDIILGDDAFGAWTHLALVLQANLHAVVPAHHLRIVDFTPGRAHVHPHKGGGNGAAGKPRSRLVQTLGRDDQLVEYFKPLIKPRPISQEQWEQLPASIVVREVRRTVRRNGYRPLTLTLVTTLLDPELYPADELIELRLSRWMIETNIRHLKTTLGMNQLKCKTLDGVRKERMMFLLVYNLIRLLMLDAAARQRVNLNRVSFADALAWLRLGDLRETAKLIVNPLRPGRIEPRAIKKRPTPFPTLSVPRQQLRSQLRAGKGDTS